ncbi:MAG: hypothetical protein MJZ60_03140 [Bacteroidaceae bacterium]|nr:hypothetical protein [Bacteroidaceae bacterium]
MNTSDAQVVSPVDALWALIQGQSKTVKRTLAKRLEESLKTECKPKVKMTEEEFFAKLDESIASAKAGNRIAMNEGETTDQFVDRLLCTD